MHDRSNEPTIVAKYMAATPRPPFKPVPPPNPPKPKNSLPEIQAEEDLKELLNFIASMAPIYTEDGMKLAVIAAKLRERQFQRLK